MELLALTLSAVADWALNILIVAVGLGLVIFFHELGHFAVAKWCGVKVERFSMGFGPILWRRKWGDTEYALSAIPFGGYVKMLGQDDIDPGQMTDDQVAADPRSFTSKPVLSRMAIIAAGVTMNMVTGLLFFVIAFRMGIQTVRRDVGGVRVGMPAWEHGLRGGDVITSMNGSPINEFNDILRQTALSRGDIQIVGHHEDGTTFETTVVPNSEDIRRMIGIVPQLSREVLPIDDPKYPVTVPGSPASQVDFKPGDVVVEVDGQPVESYPAIESQLAQHRDQPAKVVVERREKKDSAPERVNLTLPPQPFRTLGLRMSMGKIAAVRLDSPAARQGVEKNDVITRVDDLDVGKGIDPLKLPDYFAQHVGQPVIVQIKHEVKNDEPRLKEVTLVPESRLPWSEPPEDQGYPLSIPSIGVAVDVLANVFSIDPNGPAADLGLEPGDQILSVTIPAEPPVDGAAKSKSDPQTVKIEDAGWPYAFWQLQHRPLVKQVTLSVRHPGSKENRSVEVKLRDSEQWFRTGSRGVLFKPLTMERKADAIGEAAAMGWNYMRNSVFDIYLTLRNLLSGDLSIKSLHGPIGIAQAASAVAEQGLADFLLFLGIISVNLAVINFLPIPVLDGGHMIFLVWEAIARRKPSERVIVTATYLGFAFVVGLMITVLWVDLFVTRH